jgi:hypothetical protein
MEEMILVYVKTIVQHFGYILEALNNLVKNNPEDNWRVSEIGIEPLHE